MTGGVQSTISAVDRKVVYSSLQRGPLRTSECCLSQPAWTITPKRREHNLIVRSGKSEAEVTNNKRLRSMYCTIEELQTNTKHRAASLRQLSYLYRSTVVDRASLWQPLFRKWFIGKLFRDRRPPVGFKRPF